MTAVAIEPRVSTAATTVRPLRLEFARGPSRSTAKSRQLTWETLEKRLSQPLWLSKQSLAESRRLRAAALDGDAEALFAVEDDGGFWWRAIDCVDSNGAHDPATFRSVSALVFDVEHGMPAEAVRQHLAGTRAVVYSTYSHCPEDPRWRVVIPLKSPVHGQAWGALMEHYQELFEGRLGDIYSFCPQHLFRFPACPSDTREHFTFMSIEGEVADGMTIATEALLRRAKRGGVPLAAYAPPSATVVGGDHVNLHLVSSVEPPAPPSGPAVESEGATDASTDAAPVAGLTVLREAAAVPVVTSSADGRNLRQQFAEVVDGFKKDGDYERVRDKLLDLSMQLNEAGAWAPAFRPYPKIPKVRAKHEPWHSTLQRDLQVIDCHWLHSRRFPIFPRDPEFLDLFDGDQPFDMDLAETFAAKVWKTQHRVDEALGLTTFQQAQLCALRGTGIIQRRQDMFNGSGSGASRVQPTQGRFRRAMGVWCEKNPRMRSQQAAYQALWEARELLGVGASMSQISQLAAWKLGDGSAQLADKTVRDKLGNLDRQLAGTP